MRSLSSIQEIFAFEPCYRHDEVTVQICKANSGNHERNLVWLSSGKTGYWDQVETHVIVLAIEREGSAIFDLWAGEILPGTRGRRPDGEKWIFRVKDSFAHLGFVDFSEVTYERFYGKKAAASRVRVLRAELARPADDSTSAELAEAMKTLSKDAISEVRRFVWTRGQHHTVFRDNLWIRWQRKCSVHGLECGGHLRASHIVPWAESDDAAKMDVNNGLLLAAPLDVLFDQGYIAFSAEGLMLESKLLRAEAAKVFGVEPGLRLAWDHLKDAERSALQENLKKHLLVHAQKHGYVA
ncbi:HNH endonuclease [Pigmentiphaga aceris]|uniref:HNH endonuclease n=1 Tax=Pigmentiphaga aceris TaxID=1940612 RepID=A0A5C0B3T2_9BURK|nr:HNH endonuclease signature motif containing protein [Pigmentiphaga aceris]QEI07900.1 HNH endonuclease [Pigmentiphaga aceris]